MVAVAAFMRRERREWHDRDWPYPDGWQAIPVSSTAGRPSSPIRATPLVLSPEDAELRASSWAGGRR